MAVEYNVLRQAAGPFGREKVGFFVSSGQRKCVDV